MYSAIVVLVITVLVEVMLYVLACMGERGNTKVYYYPKGKGVARSASAYGANPVLVAHKKWPGMKWVDGKDEV